MNTFSFVASKTLSSRAMRKLGEGHVADAWSDTLAIYRLANHFHHGPSPLDRYRGIMMENAALDATIAFLASDEVAAADARRALHDVAKLPPLPSLTPCVDGFMRIQALDAILHVSAGQTARVTEPLELGDQVTILDHISVDWNFVLREVNRWFDRYIAALEQPDYQSRCQAIAALEQDQRAAAKPYRNLQGLARIMLSRNQRNQCLAIARFWMTLDYLPVEEQADVEARRSLVSIVGALAEYRRARQEFPKSLDELVPGFLTALPSDPLTSSAFCYRRDSDGYLLYSVGPNAIDEGGSNNTFNILAGREIEWSADSSIQKLIQQIPAYSDDLSFRVPRPPFKLPTPPTNP